MKEYLSFDDIVILPRFSSVKSRKDVDLGSYFMGEHTKLPIISSNMDTVTGPRLARAMVDNKALACLHRFNTVEQNIKEFKDSNCNPIVSVGVGFKELHRFDSLLNSGANKFVLDVAHGASSEVVEQVKQMRNVGGTSFYLMVGNFATKRTIDDFFYFLGNHKVDALKVGIGGGSACLTRVVAGVGLPTLASVMDCAGCSIPIVADGGCRTSGDVAKALAAGASAVMLGGMLAGTEESLSELVVSQDGGPPMKRYRGSASAESYDVQGKTASHRAAEGDSFLIPYVGSVNKVLSGIEGGIRSAMSYSGANDLDEFRNFVDFAIVTDSGYREGLAHGNKHGR